METGKMADYVKGGGGEDKTRPPYRGLQSEDAKLAPRHGSILNRKAKPKEKVGGQYLRKEDDAGRGKSPRKGSEFREW